MMSSNEISRDGFSSSYGCFRTTSGVERVSTEILKAAFLPRVKPNGNQLLRDHPSFVYDQLHHYGVDYEDLSGNGTLLLKEALQAGKLDSVPGHIRALEAEMHAEWLKQLSPEELSHHPEFVMQRYFIDASGNPEKTRTTELRNAADKVTGLHHAAGLGSEQTVYLGWKKAAVEKAAKGHNAKEANADKKKMDPREAARDARHQKYLDDMIRAKKEHRMMPGPGPIGHYMVDCEKISGGWSEAQDYDMMMLIGWNDSLEVYEASFDFGIFEGIVIFSEDDAVLDRLSGSKGYSNANEYYDEEDEENEDEEEEPSSTTSGKRKAPTKKAIRGRPTKKAKKSGKPMSYPIRLRCSDSGTGEIYSDAQKGTIKFEKADFSTFTAIVGIPCVGSAVKFTGRKIRFFPPKLTRSWDDYSYAASERARVSRWW